ncbi:MAG: protein kinase [Acidobacteriota bacterium]
MTTPYTILLVDDNEFVLRPLSRYLQEEGYAVIEARDGGEALDRLSAEVDLVILDVMMPGISGLDVLQTLRKSYSDKQLPVIMATASGGSEQIVEAFQLGASDYVTKPLDFPVVRARLQSRLRSKTVRRSARRRPIRATQSVEVRAGAILDGSYRLEALIGEGNFAEVYRATQLKLDRQVAIKLLRSNDDSEAEIRERFLREGRSTCRIEHPNAVAVLDASVTESGIPFLVTELLRGRALDGELENQGPMSPSRCAEILLPICDVLAEAHALGIVHRDIKPQNIFLHQSRHGEMVKVLDFGIAKLIGDVAVQQRLTITGAGPGTPAYMAPERFSSQQSCDGLTDVYSLGVMLYRMLTGRLPFAVSGGNLIKLAMMHQNQPPPRLTELVPTLSPAIEAVVLQALEKEPHHRPAARSLAEAYRAALGAEDTQAARVRSA